MHQSLLTERFPSETAEPKAPTPPPHNPRIHVDDFSREKQANKELYGDNYDNSHENSRHISRPGEGFSNERNGFPSSSNVLSRISISGKQPIYCDESPYSKVIYGTSTTNGEENGKNSEYLTTDFGRREENGKRLFGYLNEGSEVEGRTNYGHTHRFGQDDAIPEEEGEQNTSTRHYHKQQQFSEIQRNQMSRPQFAYIPQQFAVPVVQAQLQFMPVMLPATSFSPNQIPTNETVNEQRREPMQPNNRSEMSGQYGFNTTVANRLNSNGTAVPAGCDVVTPEVRTKVNDSFFSEVRCSTPQTRPISQQTTRDQSTTSIRRIQIPTRSSEVDKFLDAVFEQVLPSHELEKTSEAKMNSSLISSTIRGINDISYDSVPTPKRIYGTTEAEHLSASVKSNNVDSNGKNLSFEEKGMKQRTGAIPANMQNGNQMMQVQAGDDGRSSRVITQPMMLMMPVDGRMLLNNNQAQGLADGRNEMSSAVPVMIPSMISNSIVMCMSPSQSVACFSSADMRSDRSCYEHHQGSERTVCTTPLIFSANTTIYSNLDNERDADLSHGSTTMMIHSSPLPETAQSPTNMDENSRIGKLEPSPVKARFVGPSDANFGPAKPEAPPRTSLRQALRLSEPTAHEENGISYSYAGRSSRMPAASSVANGMMDSPDGELREKKFAQSTDNQPEGTHNSVVTGNIINSEHRVPGRLPIKPMCTMSDLESEALKKISEKAKNLPPPVDASRLLNIQLANLRHNEPEPMKFQNIAPPITRTYTDQSSSKVQVPQEELLDSANLNNGNWVYETQVHSENAVRQPEVDIMPVAAPEPNNPKVPPPTEAKLNDAVDEMAKVLLSIPAVHHTPDRSREKAAAHYTKQPWNVTLRKELFQTNEQLDDIREINLIFAQIIADCRKPNPYRIRSFERNQISQILRSYDVPPAALNNPVEIPNEVKMHIIYTARRWPLYFSRLYPVMEQCDDGNVNRILGVSESGVRLINPGSNNIAEPLKIIDHLEYADIAELITDEPQTLKLITRRGFAIKLVSDQTESIKSCINTYIHGVTKVKTYVRAIADYVTSEPNLLSFKAGDRIQIISRKDNGLSASNEQWLYGKLGNHYGNLPANYVQPLGEEQNFDMPSATSNEQYAAPYYPSPEDADFLKMDGANGVGSNNKFTMMQFAMLYFRKPKSVMNGEGISNQRKKKDWTWKEIAELVKYTPRPIAHSLLLLDNSDADKLAQEAFLCIMRYMGDENLKRGQTLTDCVYELLMICHQYRALRDEIYCQIIRQTTNNKSTNPESSIRGWRLFSILTAYFDCSQVLRPYLCKYLTEMANDQRRAYYGTASMCLQNLSKTLKYGGRRFLLGGQEVEATTMGKNLKRQIYHLPGGHKRVINTSSVTVVEEILQQLCTALNIRGPNEQQEFCLCCVSESDDTLKYLSNDEYILDVCTESEHHKKEYFLLMKRTVWIHPLRLDSALYIDVMFFQVVPDYVEGLLITPKGGKLSAAALDDIAKLGAYLHLAGRERLASINPNNVADLIPKSAVQMRTLQQWVDRLNKKVQELQASNLTQTEAKARFLKILEKWPMFGSSFFFACSYMENDKTKGECLVAVNKNGLKIFKGEKRDMIANYGLTQIASTNRYVSAEKMMLEIAVEDGRKKKTLVLQTEQGGEISRLLGQHIYVDSENRAYINGAEPGDVSL